MVLLVLCCNYSESKCIVFNMSFTFSIKCCYIFHAIKQLSKLEFLSNKTVKYLVKMDADKFSCFLLVLFTFIFCTTSRRRKSMLLPRDRTKIQKLICVV